MKRFTVIALALVMSLTMLTACSSSEEGGTDEVPPEYREENGPEEEGSGTEEPTDTDGDSDNGDLNSKVNMTGPEQMPDDDEESSSEE